MKKRLIFEKKKDCNEYIVYNKKKDMLGEIAYYKVRGHRKPRWWFFVEWHPMDDKRDFWIGSDCLREIADYRDKLTEIDKLKDKKS